MCINEPCRINPTFKKRPIRYVSLSVPSLWCTAFRGWTIMKSDSNQHFISQPSDLSLTNYLCFMWDFFLYLKICMARWQRHNAFWTQEGGQFHVQQTMGTSQPSWQTWHTRCEMSGAHRSGIMEGHGEQHGRKSRWKDEKSDRSKVSLIEPVWWYCD